MTTTSKVGFSAACVCFSILEPYASSDIARKVQNAINETNLRRAYRPKDFPQDSRSIGVAFLTRGRGTRTKVSSLPSERVSPS